MKNLLFLVLLISVEVLAIDKEVKIGATVPLSGNLATYGNLIKGGMEFAKEDLLKEGIDVSLVFEDTPLVGAGIMTAANKLIYHDKVDAIGGNFANPAMLAMGNILEKEKVPAFHTAAADPGIVNFERFIFSTNVRIKDEAYHLAEYAYNTKSYRKMAVITVHTNFGEAYRKFFKERFVSLGGEIVADETYEVSDMDYKTQLTKIRAKKPEAIFGACFGNFLGQTMKEARELGINVPFYSVYESEDTSVLDVAGGRAEGLKYFITVDAKTNPLFNSFRDRFIEKYKREPGTFASNSYDATVLIAHAFKKCDSDKECVLSELYGTKDYKGVSGEFSIGEDGIATKHFVLREIKGGKFVDAE